MKERLLRLVQLTDYGVYGAVLHGKGTSGHDWFVMKFVNH